MLKKLGVLLVFLIVAVVLPACVVVGGIDDWDEPVDPAISIEGSIVSWNTGDVGVVRNYDIRAVVDGVVLYAEVFNTRGMDKVEVDLALIGGVGALRWREGRGSGRDRALPAGDVEISVVAIEIYVDEILVLYKFESDWSNTVVWEREVRRELTTPSEVEIFGDVVSWDYTGTFGQYIVRAVVGDVSVYAQAANIAERMSLNLQNVGWRSSPDMRNGLPVGIPQGVAAISIRVQDIDSQGIRSYGDWSEVVVWGRELLTPGNVEIYGNILTWDRTALVGGVDSNRYIVRADFGETMVYAHIIPTPGDMGVLLALLQWRDSPTVAGSSIVMPLPSGNAVITVRGQESVRFSEWSASVIWVRT